MKEMVHFLRQQMSKWLDQFAGVWTGIALMILWEFAAAQQWLPRFVFPAPSAIVKALWHERHLLWSNSRVTLLQAFIGLGLGVGLAFLFAIVMDMFRWVHRAVYPLLIVSQTIPTIAIAPILVLWLGYDMTPKIVLVVLTTLFPIVISILNGFVNCDHDAIQLLTLMGANRWQILQHVKLPSAMPYFYSGLRVSVSYAFVSAVVAEWLGGFEGLGVYMIQTKKAFSYDKMFAVIVVISVLSLFFMWLVTLIERISIPWQFGKQRKY